MAPTGRVLLVGAPNVGKSVLFHRLTGVYVTVSNYPGTTVEVSRGRMQLGGTTVEVVDTPGLYSLRPVSDEERVARDIITRDDANLLVHVLDIKNLRRMLVFTLELLETGLPLLVAANMADEAERLGLEVDPTRIAARLGVPVVVVAALRGTGIATLRTAIEAALPDA
jgi:ferrous iron transport protein B